MSFRFKMLARKMIAVEERITNEKGPLNLFALLQRWGAGGYHYLDLIIAADWAYRDESATRHYLIDVFEEELEPEEKYILGAVLVMDPKDDDVRAASRFGQVEHRVNVILDDSISWRAFRRAYLIMNNWPAADSKIRETKTVSKKTSKGAKAVSARQRAARDRVS